ncbi:serine/threonine-protein kinase [Protofrankia symbiont of Coriaria ruscifolia]|uniref:serine/threonine-protein kinase n=1 Tax=Protofrankia symbiont of Coriaria ruscifolia TaxID=1306542 RepID=UPI00104127E7|nr:serine/threonine-protein kinase [Protofrankia symbiont of Coriaria ruscifolia]
MPVRDPLRSDDPERVGTYRLTARLGAGGQGVVYLGHGASDEGASDEGVAIKLLRADLSGDAAARQRFIREVAAAKRVARFCTAQVLDADVDGDQPYIVSEYVDGPSLQHLVSSQGPRDGGALERLAIGTATALAAIHAAGVVHRDFKPGNVLIGPDGPRVIDFGIARALDTTNPIASQAIGTPAYMAPEQVAGSDVGPAADVFAWGATIVFAATGHSPFGSDSVPAVFHRILYAEPELGELPGPLRELVAACLAKDPHARPRAHQVLIGLLGQDQATTGGEIPPGVDAQPAGVLTQGANAAATLHFDHFDRFDGARGPGMTRLLPDRPTSQGAHARRWILALGAAVVAVGAVLVVLFWPSGSGPSEQQTNGIASAFAGTWSGQGRIPYEGVDVTWTVYFRVDGRIAQVESGQSSCAGGTLTWLRGTATRMEMRYVPPPTCTPGRVTVTSRGQDQMIFRVEPDSDMEPPYEGTLHRV